MFIGHTRFSLFDPTSKAWVASNGSKLTTPEEYRDYLFSEGRMEPRAKVFFEYTLPMLDLASEGFAFRHVVAYSEVLPDKYQGMLEDAAIKYPWLILDRVSMGGGLKNVAGLAQKAMAELDIPRTTTFGSMRLDDDDVLSADYFEQMTPYVKAENVGYIVSLSRGVSVLQTANGFYYARDADFPMHSKGHLGVCRFDETGKLHEPVSAPHNKTDRYNPVIVDGRKFSHLWVRSLTQDTSLYQHGLDEDKVLARIYKDMDQYPPLNESIEGVFPVLVGKIHADLPN